MAGFFSLLRRLYLSFYNWLVFFGWFQVLYLVLKTLMESGHQHVYNAAEKPLLFAQTAAVLECGVELHGVLDSSWFGRTGEVSSDSNIATDRFKIVPDLGHLMEFP